MEDWRASTILPSIVCDNTYYITNSVHISRGLMIHINKEINIVINLSLLTFMEQTILDKQRRLRCLYTIVNKDGETKIFSPNKSQIQLMQAKKKSREARNGVCRLMNLKARQVWITTFELIDWLDECLFKINQTITISAHKLDKMKDFFHKVKFAYDNIPDAIKDERVPGWIWHKPKPQYNNVNELYFPDTNSRIKITLDTRSWTPTRLHITEIAFKEWATEMMAATLPSLPATADGTIETTANGIGNYFHTTWVKNYGKPYGEWAWDCFFIPRYTDPDYISSKYGELPSEYEYIKSIEHEWAKLSQEQINWYCERIEELGNIVKQEFPSYPEVAFLASGRPVFDNNIVNTLIEPKYEVDEIYPGLRRYSKDKTRKAIYGVDTSEWGRDWDPSSIKVRDQDTMELLASYNWHMPADALCEVIDRIEAIFWKCIIAIEKNNTGLATISEAKNYTWHNKLYATKQLDTTTMRTSDKIWWITTSSSRPLMIQDYETAIRTWIITQIDERQRSEMFTFVYNEKNKPEAVVGCHDDDILSDAICFQMRYERVIYQEENRVKKDTRPRRDYVTGKLIYNK